MYKSIPLKEEVSSVYITIFRKESFCGILILIHSWRGKELNEYNPWLGKRAS